MILDHIQHSSKLYRWNRYLLSKICCYLIPNPSPNWHEPAWQNCPAGQFIFFRQLTHLSWYPQNLLIFWCAQCKSLTHSAHVLNRQFVFFSLLLYQTLDDACLLYFSNLNKLARKSEIKEWYIKLKENSNWFKLNYIVSTWWTEIWLIYPYFLLHRRNRF